MLLTDGFRIQMPIPEMGFLILNTEYHIATMCIRKCKLFLDDVILVGRSKPSTNYKQHGDTSSQSRRLKSGA